MSQTAEYGKQENKKSMKLGGPLIRVSIGYVSFKPLALRRLFLTPR